jgi:hypothetical protein
LLSFINEDTTVKGIFSAIFDERRKNVRVLQCYNDLWRILVMAKSRDARKDVKKKPAKSIIEKRKAKQEKKSK